MHRLYENEDITVFWDSDKCRHAKVCVTQSPTVFNINRRPWIDIGGAKSAEIWQTVEKCPSGALTCVYNHDIAVVFDEERNCSLAFDGDAEVGECCYREDDAGWVIEHTGVRPEYEGKGIAKRLVYKVSEEAEKRHVAVIPLCSYAVRVLGS